MTASTKYQSNGKWSQTFKRSLDNEGQVIVRELDTNKIVQVTRFNKSTGELIKHTTHL